MPLPASKPQAAPAHGGAGARLHLVAGPRPGFDLDALLAACNAHPLLRPEQLVLHRLSHGLSLAAAAAQASAQAGDEGGIVVACGGDGTVNTVAQAVWPLGLPMAVLPQGTFNFFSRAQGLGENATQALDQLLQWLPQGSCNPVAVALANEQLFLVNASLGLYPRLLADREQAKQRFGRHRWVALVSGAASLLGPSAGHAVTMLLRDGSGAVREQQLNLSTLFIGNNALQLRQLGLQAPADPADGAMTALMFAPQGRAAMARMAWRAFRGRLPEEPALTAFDFTELELHASGRRRLDMAFDGETRRMRMPLRITRAMRPLWLVAPPLAEPMAKPEPEPEPEPASILARDRPMLPAAEGLV